MNMTRAILEGIHEVELQITPEFQKEPRDEGVDGADLHVAFNDNGWSLANAKHNAQMKTTTNGYDHPKIPGAEMRYTYRTETGKVVGQMLVRAGPDSDPLWFDPDGPARDEYSFRRGNWHDAVGRECTAVRSSVGVLDQSSFPGS